MIQSGHDLPDEDRIDAALAEAVNQPLESLLAIREFAEKLGGIERARLALEALSETSELRNAA